MIKIEKNRNMRINPNYLKIYEKKEKNHFIFHTILAQAFKNVKISKKHIFWWFICCCLIGFSYAMKASSPTVGQAIGGNFSVPGEIKSLDDVFQEIFAQATFPGSVVLMASMKASFAGLEVVKTFLEWVSEIQLSAISVVEKTPFGSRGMFNTIYKGLTIFAVIGCLYKLIVHFLNTERHDNVKAYTGYFQYLSIAILFVFSDSIVGHVVSLNEGVNADNIRQMNLSLSNELDKALKKDLEGVVESIGKLEEKNSKLNPKGIDMETRLEKLSNNFSIWKLETFDGNIYLTFKYTYFTITTMLISSIMSIPAFILAIMVKILLTVMVAGTQLVFLLAFIPGFENTWKTFMLNMLNILLWIPIFNALYSFIVYLIVGLMTDQTLGSGQIVWLTIVSIILAFQSLSLTTSAAGVVINGAGASMAGAMGSMATMNGVSAGLGIAKAGVGVAGLAVGGAIAGGASKSLANSIGNSVANSMEKYMKK